jgi:hypothetical protein
VWTFPRPWDVTDETPIVEVAVAPQIGWIDVKASGTGWKDLSGEFFNGHYYDWCVQIVHKQKPERINSLRFLFVAING